MNIKTKKCEHNPKRLSCSCAFRVSDESDEVQEYHILIPNECFNSWKIGSNEKKEEMAEELGRIKAQTLYKQGSEQKDHKISCSALDNVGQAKEVLKKELDRVTS